MKYLLFGSAKLCRFKVSEALTVRLGGSNGSEIARAKAPNDKSEACEVMSSLKEKSKICIVLDKIVFCFSVSSC